MAEQFRKDPTKKPEAERGKQKTPEAAKSPEPSPEQKRMMGNQKTIGDAMEMLYNTLSTDTGDSALWQDKTDTWRKNLKRVLVEPRGSITVEREELVEPISMLAFQALRRDDPKDKISVSEVEAIASRQNKETAHKALRLMLDRYSDKFELTDFSKANIMATASRLGRELAQSHLYGDSGQQLDALATKKSTDNFRVISDIDAIIESLSMSLAGNAKENYEASSVPKWDDSAKVLPQLKALMQLRGNLSLQLLGQYKSPDEVLAIQRAREQAVGASTEVPSTNTPIIKLEAAKGGKSEVTEREKKEKEVLDAILRDGPSQIHTSCRGGDRGRGEFWIEITHR